MNRVLPFLGLLTALGVGGWAVAQPLELACELGEFPGARISLADYDGNGKLDILVAGSERTVLFRNGSGTGFTPVEVPFPAVAGAVMAWGDYDNDGDLDLVIAGNGTTRLFRNDGPGGFVEVPTALPGIRDGQVAWGDYDQDGDLDLVVVGTNDEAGPLARVYKNMGAGTFVASELALPAIHQGSAAWCDLDRDGYLDLLVTGTVATNPPLGSLAVYRNLGQERFAPLATGLPGYTASLVTGGDYNADGNLDLLITGGEPSGISLVRVVRNDGHGVFALGMARVLTPECITWMDRSGDGYLDFFLSGLGSTVPYRYDGNDVFNEDAWPIAEAMSGVAWGDLDGDGSADLVAGVYDNELKVHVRVFRNPGVTAPPPPPAPTGLTAALAGNQVSLSWEAVTAGPAPKGLSYNLRVGRSSGQSEVVSAMADPVTGFRRLSALGNAQQTTNWTLILPVGTYYWSVQAIDSLSRGSAFAAEESFTVPAGLPLVVSRPATNITATSAVLRGTVNPNTAATTAWFEYGPGTDYGHVTPPMELGNGAAPLAYTNGVADLAPSVLYHFRLVATNQYGAMFGADESFTTVNTPPSLSSLSNLAVGPGQSPPALPFTVDDLETPASNLVVVATSSRTNLVPNENLLIGGTGANQTLQITPLPAQKGSTTITLTVRDVLGLTATASFVFTVEEFTLVATLPFGSLGSVVGDLDADGRPDILLAGPTRWYRNLGGLTFTNLQHGLTDPNPSFALAALGDYDNDGNLDVARTGETSTQIASPLFRNSGNGSLVTNVYAGVPVLGEGALAWGDCDNDGALDLLLTSMTNHSLGPGFAGVFANNGNRTFRTLNLSLPAVMDGAVAWADYDGDGYLDFILAGATNGVGRSITRLYHNNGNRTFTPGPAPFPGLSLGALAWGDYDNDGRPDLLLAGNTNTYDWRRGVATLYHNNGDGSFTDIGAGLPGLVHAAAAWGDFDNDGRLDFVLAGPTSLLGTVTNCVYFNHGDGTFTRVPFGPKEYEVDSVACADLDGDGDLDLVIGTTSGTRIYRNNLNRPPVTPDAPSELAASLSGTNATLSWVAPIATGGLTFNLRVGRNPGGTEVVGPMANPATGQRFVAQPGNAGSRLNWPLSRLTVGTYYWSVQSINAAFAASAFAPEASFVIGEAAPLADTGPARNVAATSAVLSGEVNPNNLATVVYFEYGRSTGYGEFTLPRDMGGGTNGVPLYTTLNQLDPATAYQFRLVASNAQGVAYGGNQSFTTLVAAPFAEFPAGPPSMRFMQLAGADYDNNGALDFFVTGLLESDNSRSATLYANLGPGLFMPTASQWLKGGSGAAAWGDYDRDGNLDLVLTGYSPNAVAFTVLYHNNGNGTFTEVPAGLAAVYDRAAAHALALWGDYNNDGAPDLLLAGWDSADNLITRLYRNDGNGHFTDVNAGFPGFGSAAAAWADYDNDGWLDVVISGTTNDLNSGTVTLLYHNEGNGTFKQQEAGLAGGRSGSVGWGDYDNDGDLDLLLAVSETHLYRNDGGGTFTEVAAGLPAVSGGTGAWGDYDHDGWLDLVLAGGTLTRLYHNNGDGTFADAGIKMHNAISGRAAWGDYDGDGRLDFLLAGSAPSGSRMTNFVSLFHNDLPGANAPPVAPTGLRALVTGKAVELQWEAATDPNQHGGLSYNFRVGTAPAIGNVVSPDADGLTGTRRLAGLGNAGLRRFARLVNLAPGTYHWSVQAIDHGFAGSPFAPEQTFVIPSSGGEKLVLSGARFSPEGRFQFEVMGLPGQHVVIDTATDLNGWTSGPTNLLDSGSTTFTEPAPPASRQFYRARLTD